MICVAIAIWPGDRPKACIMLVVLGIAAWIAALAPFKE